MGRQKTDGEIGRYGDGETKDKEIGGLPEK
jgi:hypothetical protein